MDRVRVSMKKGQFQRGKDQFKSWPVLNFHQGFISNWYDEVPDSFYPTRRSDG